MTIFSILIIVTFAINIFLVFAMVFIERKKPHIIVAWLVVLTFLPIVGFIIYTLIGSGLSYKTKKMIKTRQLHQKDYEDFINSQKSLFTNRLIPAEEKEYLGMMLFNLNNSKSAYFRNNDVRVFLNGKDKILALKKDLLSAKHSINILYYIFANDEVGNKIMKILIKKARQGVKVKFLYDSVGCARTHKSFFKKLEKAGGEVAEFFPPLFGIRLANLKMNYRNHRKIVVIDGKIGYTGGINIRDDHMGNNEKLSPWRDTHIKITGAAVYGLQNAFFNDWRYCKRINDKMSNLLEEGYYPKAENDGKIGAQIITSGPDCDNQPIKDSLVKMILLAREKVYIQTPYFVPDEIVMSALKIAKMSGVDVKVIIPSKPDKKFVYLATLSYVKELLPTGIEFYTYNGFIHSKQVIIDDKVVSIGTCNFDNRSFSLNFEINAFLYGKEFALLNQNYFQVDLNNSKQIDLAYFKRKPWINKVGQAFVRLFSPLL